MKQCTVCKEHKSLEEYYANKRSADGKGYRCKACDTETRRQSRARNPSGTKAGYRRRILMWKYNLTPEAYVAILDAQDGVCAICKTQNPLGEGNTTKRASFSFSVDHCHATGKIRGLLCNTCNRGLGFFKDSPDLLIAARQYLECH